MPGSGLEWTDYAPAGCRQGSKFAAARRLVLLSLERIFKLHFIDAKLNVAASSAKFPYHGRS